MLRHTGFAGNIGIKIIYCGLLTAVALGVLGCGDDNPVAPTPSPPAPDVYISGRIETATTFIPGFWKNGTFTALPVHDQTRKNYAKDIYFTNGSEYVCGSITNAGGVLQPCYWVNQSRLDLTVIDSNESGDAYAVFVEGNDTYVAGVSHVSGNRNIPCVWANGVRTDLPLPDAQGSGMAHGVAVSGTTVYVAGYSYIPTLPSNPTLWVNGVRTVLSSVDPARGGVVYDVFVSGGTVYAAGFTRTAADLQVPCYWAAGARVDLPVSSSEDGAAHSVTVSGADIFVTGTTIVRPSSVPCIWKGGTQSDLPPLAAGQSAWSHTIRVSGATVRAAGYSRIVGSNETRPCYWVNGTIHELSMPAGATRGYTSGMFVDE